MATVTMRDVPIYFGGTGLKWENYENGDLNREVCIMKWENYENGDLNREVCIIT